MQAIDAASFYNGEATALTFSFDKTSGVNGDVLNLTINVLAQDPLYQGEVFELVSSRGGDYTVWWGAVGN